VITDAADIEVFECVFVSAAAEVSDVPVETVGVTAMDTEVVVNCSEVIPTSVDTEVVIVVNCEVIPVVPPFSTTENVGLSYSGDVTIGPGATSGMRLVVTLLDTSAM